jgi:hypothetical protein
MNRSGRWAYSPLDRAAHLLARGDHPSGVLAARCGRLLPMIATVHDQPPFGCARTANSPTPQAGSGSEFNLEFGRGPGWILPRQAQYQVTDLGTDWWAA